MQIRNMEQQPYIQDSKRDTDIKKNRLLASVGEGEVGII